MTLPPGFTLPPAITVVSPEDVFTDGSVDIREPDAVAQVTGRIEGRAVWLHMPSPVQDLIPRPAGRRCPPHGCEPSWE